MPDARARYRPPMTDTSIQPAPVPDRVPLARLAREDGRSGILARVVAQDRDRGPARVAVAAFQSSV